MDTPVFWSACSLFKAKCEEARFPSAGCMLSLGQDKRSRLCHWSPPWWYIFWSGFENDEFVGQCSFSPRVVLASLDEHCHYLSLCFSFISVSLADSHHTMPHCMLTSHLHLSPCSHYSLFKFFFGVQSYLSKYENPPIHKVIRNRSYKE